MQVLEMRVVLEMVELVVMEEVGVHMHSPLEDFSDFSVRSLPPKEVLGGTQEVMQETLEVLLRILHIKLLLPAAMGVLEVLLAVREEEEFV
jgi:hypothetical protein